MNPPSVTTSPSYDPNKQSSLGLIYQLVDQFGPISRSKLAEYGQLAPASLTKITRQLLPLQLIQERDEQESTGGRRAINLTTIADAYQVVVVRIGSKHLHIGLCDLAGVELATRYVGLCSGTAELLEHQISDEISTLLARHQSKQRPLIAIALTSTGLINTKLGTISRSPHFEVDQPLAIADHIHKIFDVPCYISNHTRALALAELYFGNARHSQDVIVVRAHQDIGAGIIIDGAALMGQDQNRGALGHVQVDPLGQRCRCGNFGCLETVASDNAILQRFQKLAASGYSSRLSANTLTISEICQAALAGDQLALQVLKEAAEYMGKALATTVNLLNPRKIVIGGNITQAWAVIAPIIETTLERQSLVEFHSDLSIEFSTIERQSLLAPFALIKRALFNGQLIEYLTQS